MNTAASPLPGTEPERAGRPLRVMISAGFSAGHALPALALARALRERDHEVLLHLSERWREPALELGSRFAPASDYVAFPGAAVNAGEPTVVDVARALPAMIRDFGADLVVGDLVAPATPLAAELAEVRGATLIPTVYPVQGPGHPPFPLGLLPPRTRLGAGAWRALEPATRPLRPAARWLRRVPGLLADARAELGLAARPPGRAEITTYGPISDELAMVATFPQLEYPRDWPPQVHVTGPMRFELPHPEVELPAGDDPLVVVAPSTVHDSARALVGAATAALASEPVRVAATLNQRGAQWTEPAPPNAVVTDWLSYAQVMPKASLVISNGGHGTVVRALAEGVPVLVCPVGADTAENGARVTWRGAGLMIPARLLGPTALRAGVRRLLAEPRFVARARELATWARDNDGARRGAALLERHAAGSGS